MKYEKINKKYTNIIIISLVVIIIGSVLVLNITKAKYKITVSVPIVSGTINYSLADLNVMAIYFRDKDEDNYTQINSIPTKGYVLNAFESYCTLTTKEEKLEDVPIEYKDGRVYIGVNTKGTKCYLYFDKSKYLKDNIIAKATDEELEKCPTTFESIEDTESLICEADDDFGESYYFRGNVEDNWVKFGKDKSNYDIYWRIIRINGDGTIRLIYAGTNSNGKEPDTIGVQTQIGSYAFNSQANSNMYVGYEYASSNMHGKGVKSNALTQLNSWFTSNLNEEWNEGTGSIDLNAGFCNDRSGSTNENANWSEDMSDSGGTGTTQTYYGYLRLYAQKQPTLKCSTTYTNRDSIINKNKDYFTYEKATGIKQTGTDTFITGTKSLDYPIGLITADEVAFAGTVYNQENKNYWLYTGQNYWTMTPYIFNRYVTETYELSVRSDGGLIGGPLVSTSCGLRPVINLKANTLFTIEHPDEPKGTSTNPYIVK